MVLGYYNSVQLESIESVRHRKPDVVIMNKAAQGLLNSGKVSVSGQETIEGWTKDVRSANDARQRWNFFFFFFFFF